MREAADCPEGVCRLREVEIREGVRLACGGFDAEVQQQRLADEVRRPPARGTEAEIDIRLTEVDRIELRVAVGEMQQAHVSERGGVVVERGPVATLERRAALNGQPGRRGGRDHVQEFAAVHNASGVTPVRGSASIAGSRAQ